MTTAIIIGLLLLIPTAIALVCCKNVGNCTKAIEAGLIEMPGKEDSL